jgi:hypothetical protein
MSFYSGSSGELWLDGVKAARVSGWSLSSSLGLLDATSLADTDRVQTPGIRSTTGSCTLFYYAEDPTDRATNSASALINKLIKARLAGQVEGQAQESELVRLKLRIADSTTEGKYVTVDAYLTSVQMAMAVGAVLSAEVAFEAVGAPLEVLL